MDAERAVAATPVPPGIHARRAYRAGMANIHVRDVPDDVHRRLKSQAALAGQSLNDFLLARMHELTSTPKLGELAQRIRQRDRYDGPSSRSPIRDDRDRR